MASRVLGAFAVAATATLASLALATPASAHTPVSSAECVKDKAVLKVKLTQYAGGNKNTVLIKDGDTVLADEKFGQSWGEKKFELDGTVGHTFTIKVTAWDGAQFNYNKTHKTPPCVTPTTTKPSETTTTTTPPVETTTTTVETTTVSEPPATTSVPEEPSSSEAPSTTPAPAPGGSTPDEPLASTGAAPLVMLLSGVGLVGAGAGTLLFLRRRRSA